MIPKEKCVDARMYDTLIAQLLTNQPDLDGLKFDRMKAAINNPNISSDFAAWINNGCQVKQVSYILVPTPTVAVIDLKIDPNKSIAELVAAGKYAQKHVESEFIERACKVRQILEDKELVRVCFHREVANRADVGVARAALGLEPVTSPLYLLTLGVENPGILRDGAILDVDSITSHGDAACYLSLWREFAMTRLNLRRERSVKAGCWVLALRNKL